MGRFAYYILVLYSLMLSVTSNAQEEGVAVDTIRSVIEPPTIYEEERRRSESSFLPITQQVPVTVRNVPDEKIEALKGEDDYWYANAEPEKKRNEEDPQSKERKKGLLDQKWLRNLLWIIILCSFIGIVIWYLASSNIQLFRKTPEKIIDDQEGEEITEDIFSIQYDREIHKAEQEGNYRLAVRLWYLKTLKELADRDIIDYRHEKTDNDYVNSLYGSRYHRDFFRLTRNFEYTWYGQFALSAEAYRMMQADFSQFKNTLS